MQLRHSERKKAKIKMALQGSAGSGKTYSSLLLAQGLTNGDFTKVAIIDTENGSADLYAHLGDYNVLTLTPPFTPENYIKAIDVCEKAGMEVIIIDSITHEWNHLLEIHGAMSGNSFTNWAYITPRHERFKNKILQSSCHIITTVRRKTEYAIDQSSGKTKIEKVGTKEQSREGWEYELTVNLEIDENHKAKASKDRTGIFVDRDLFIITEEDGKTLREWSKVLNIKYTTLYMRITRQNLSFEEAININKEDKLTEYKGIKKSLKDWCLFLNLPYKTIIDRKHQGWSIEDCFERPIKKVKI